MIATRVCNGAGSVEELERINLQIPRPVHIPRSLAKGRDNEDTGCCSVSGGDCKRYGYR